MLELTQLLQQYAQQVVRVLMADLHLDAVAGAQSVLLHDDIVLQSTVDAP
jgi:hypothetical protein